MSKLRGIDVFKKFIKHHSPVWNDGCSIWCVHQVCDECKAHDICEQVTEYTSDDSKEIKEKHPEYFV
jgi:hypothetical protein